MNLLKTLAKDEYEALTILGSERTVKNTRYELVELDGVYKVIYVDENELIMVYTSEFSSESEGMNHLNELVEYFNQGANYQGGIN